MLIDKTALEACRHRLERPFFVLAAILTILLFAIILGVSAFKEKVTVLVEQEYISSYKKDHPEAKEQSNAELLKKMPADDKQSLESIKSLSLPMVLLAPIGLGITTHRQLILG